MAHKSTSQDLKQYNASFQEALRMLNPVQKEAVENIEGPVMVIAGPGTGKTHILTARIGRILMETDTLPHNILCLTFTDAGVMAMRERLLEFIGPDAHRVHINTFHSFCNSVIQDNLELFGRHDLEPISELENVELIRTLIDELPVDHLLKSKSDIYFYEGHLRNLFQTMKKENWSPDFVQKGIDDYITSLPERAEFIYQKNTTKFVKGEPKQHLIDDAITKTDRLSAAVKIYDLYVGAMENARRYDFDDMILWVIRAFKDNESLLRSYQEQYLYFLVDEYQDTNGAQNQILNTLISYWQEPNVYIVGDDDQAIYEFQGARLKNLEEFYDSYKGNLKLLWLIDNYRSSQNILDASRFLINNNQKRIVNAFQNIDKKLLAHNPEFANIKTLPEIREYPNRFHEDTDIVLQLERMKEAGYPLNEVAIIYAKHKQAANIIALLEKKNIPYNSKKSINILDLPLIQNLRLLLDYLYAEYRQPHSGENILFQILHFNFFNIDHSDLERLSVACAELLRAGKDVVWRKIIRAEDFLQKAKLAQPDKIINFTTLSDELIAEIGDIPIPVFLEKIINKSGLIKLLLSKDNRSWDLQVISTFFNFAKAETDKNPRLSLKRFLDILRSMDSNRLSIPVQKTIYHENGVHLITAHSAKGLEFQHVFLIDCIKELWEQSGRGGNFNFSFPDTLTLSGEEDALEARRRLFYVGMTRAKEKLWISYSKKNSKDKDLQKAIFLDEVIDGANIPIQQIRLDQSALLDAQYLMLLEVEKPRIQSPDKASIDALLSNFTLSISSLNAFVRCPLSFYYEQILRLPSTIREAALYGTAVHNALKRLFDKMLISEGKEFPTEDDFILYFEDDMKRRRGGYAPKEYLRRMDMGKINLRKLYQQEISSWPKSVKVEMDIRNVEIAGVPLTGTIDRLDNKRSHYHVVDYKTGSVGKEKLTKMTDKNGYGGLYRRQLLFYKILFEASYPANKPATHGSIFYLDPNAKGEFLRKEIEFIPEEVQKMKYLIKDSYQKIKNHEFYTGCGEPKCKWCNFVKNNVNVDTFADHEAEDLDD